MTASVIYSDNKNNPEGMSQKEEKKPSCSIKFDNMSEPEHFKYASDFLTAAMDEFGYMNIMDTSIELRNKQSS